MNAQTKTDEVVKETYTVNKADLERACKLLRPVIPKTHAMPILEFLHFRVTNNLAEVTGTDLELQLVAHNVPMEGPDRAFTLPANKLSAIVGALSPDKPVTLTIDNQGTCQLRSGTSRYKLQTMDADSFPVMETEAPEKQISVAQSVVKELFSNTQYAMGKADVRYYLNGALMEVSRNKLRVAATDGHRLAVAEKEGTFSADETPSHHILPRKAVLEVSSLLSEIDTPIKLGFSGRYIQFASEKLTFTAKPIDGKFPEYNAILADVGKYPNAVIVDRDTLLNAINRTIILSADKQAGMRFQFRDTDLQVSFNNAEQESSEESVPVAYKQSTPDEMGLSGRYLQEVLSTCASGEIEIKISGPTESIMVTDSSDSNHRHVIMPMRL